MRLISPIPIEVFVKNVVRDQKVEALFDGLYINRDLLSALLIVRYRDMGISMVTPSTSDYLQADVLVVLKTAPEFLSLARQARREAAARQNKEPGGT